MKNLTIFFFATFLAATLSSFAQFERKTELDSVINTRLISGEMRNIRLTLLGYEERGMQNENASWGWRPDDGWFPGEKWMYFFDWKRRHYKTIEYSGKFNEWTNHEKAYYYFDENDEVVESVVEYWDEINENWFYYTRNLYEYDDEGRLIENPYYAWKNDDWALIRKYSYIYDLDSDNPSEVIFYFYEDGAWVPNDRHLYSYEDGKEIREVYQVWAEGWQDVTMTEQDFDAEGKIVFREHKSFDEAIWNNIFRTFFKYNQSGDRALDSTQTWKGDAYADTTVRYYYYEDDLLVRTSQWNVIDGEKVEFDINFYKYKEILASTPEPVDRNFAKLSFYPNPTQNSGNLTLELESPGVVYISATDVSGKAFKTFEPRILPAGVNEIELPLGDIPRGACYLRIRSDGKESSVPILIGEK